MITLDINSTRYAVRVHQRNDSLPWLLMLHGFMGDHRVFNHLVDEACKFCNPITPDLLGFGKSAKPANPNRFNDENQVRDLLQLVELIDEQPLFMHGYSMGGRLALHTVLADSTNFRGLILESTNCGISDPRKRKERRKVDARRSSRITENYSEFLAEWEQIEIFRSPLEVDSELHRQYKKIQSQQAPPALANSLAGFGTGTMTPVCDRVNQLDLPVLLIAGSADEKYQQINGDLVKRIPNATFASILASHRVHLDNPQLFLEKIRTFIEANNPL